MPTKIRRAAICNKQRARRPAASPFVCLLNMSDGQVNLVLGPETHNGADKKAGMRAMTRTNSGTGPFVRLWDGRYRAMGRGLP